MVSSGQACCGIGRSHRFAAWTCIPAWAEAAGQPPPWGTFSGPEEGDGSRERVGVRGIWIRASRKGRRLNLVCHVGSRVTAQVWKNETRPC